MKTALYVHIPFCKKKCLYCSFTVVVAQRHRVDSYLDCLRSEAGRYKGRRLDTIHIGGGTPTWMSNDQWMRLKEMIKKMFCYCDQTEFTVEANPEGLDLAKAKFLFALGINRISLGVQSFQDKYLKFLGRCHDAQDAVAAFAHLRKAGFDNINLDLMYSFPGQTLREIEEDVAALIRLESEHVSLYTFTVEPYSRFYAQGLKQQDGGKQSEQYEFVARLLTQAGFRQYEVSNFARPGKESRHNSHYWQGGNYIGLGVGAHSHKNGRRYWNVSRLNEYISRIKNHGDPTEGSEDLTPQTRLRESLLFGLRMNAGIDLKKLERKFQCRLPEEKSEKIQEFIKGGLLDLQGNRLQATDRGRLVLDEMSAYLI